MSEFFICDQNQIATQLARMRKTGESDDKWSFYYKDDMSDKEWELTRYHSEYQGGGMVVLKQLPVPSIDELINIALYSIDKNDIIGASLELAEMEQTKKEDFREKVLNKLTDLLHSDFSDFDKERIRIIIHETEMLDATNRRNIVGKHWKEIEADANYYRSVSIKAKEMLNKIGWGKYR